MKILQLIQKPQLRGAEMFASQLSQNLTDEGHTCFMVSIFEGEAVLPFNGEFIKLNRPIRKRFFDWQAWKKLAEIIKEKNPDIIQANAGDTLKFAVFSKIFFGWKTPIVFRNANKISDFINSKFKYHLNNFFVKKVSYVISVSELCRLDFIKTFSFDPSKVKTVEIGVEISTQKEKNLNIPSDLNSIFESNKVFLSVGSLVPEKNQLRLLEIFAKVQKIHSNCILLLIGKGHLEIRILEKIQSLQLTKNVFLLGYRNDVLQIMSNASALLMPSLIEGLPGVILEAQLSKLPVVAYNVGGISEVIENNKTGYLIPKNDEQQFTEAILDVLNDNNLSKNSVIKEKAYHQVLTKFDNKIIAKRFSEVYEEILR